MIAYIKKMTKTDEKKMSFKNWYVDHVLLYHFLNDENHTQNACPGKKNLFDRVYWNINEWKQLLLYLYLCILERENLN